MGEDSLPPPPPHGVRPIVYFMASIASLSGFLMGFDMGGSGGTFVMDGFRDYFHWPRASQGADDLIADQLGWVAAMFTLGRMIGTLPSGYLGDRFGRRPSMIGLSLLLALSGLLYLNPVNLYGLYTARFLCGFLVAALTTPAIIYQSETCPAHARGMVASIQEMAICSGLFVGGLVNVGLEHYEQGWRVSYAIITLIAMVMAISMYSLPESPRWLMAQGREGDAIEALGKMRHSKEVQAELELMRREVMNEKGGSWLDLFKRKEVMGYRTMVSLMALTMPLLTGVVHITIYTPVVFSTFISPSNAILAFMGVIGAEVLTTILTIRYRLMERVGRRGLLVVGSLLLALCCGVFALFTSPSYHYHTDRAVAMVLIGAIAAFVMNFAFSWGPLAWLVAAEVFPQHLRGKGVTLSTLANCTVFFILTRAGPLMSLPNHMNLWGTFAFFAALNVLVALAVLLFFPETNRVPLEDMEDTFRSFMATPWYRRLTLTSPPTPPVAVVRVSGGEGPTKGDACLEMVGTMSAETSSPPSSPLPAAAEV